FLRPTKRLRHPGGRDTDRAPSGYYSTPADGSPLEQHNGLSRLDREIGSFVSEWPMLTRR
ncbi:hypothetical protein M4S82_16195, partial [Planococcus sp. MERTA32b]|nr:hypothetical protein [Planococcus sp. MER TA 32b]